MVAKRFIEKLARPSGEDARQPSGPRLARGLRFPAITRDLPTGTPVQAWGRSQSLPCVMLRSQSLPPPRHTPRLSGDPRPFRLARAHGVAPPHPATRAGRWTATPTTDPATLKPTKLTFELYHKGSTYAIEAQRHDTGEVTVCTYRDAFLDHRLPPAIHLSFADWQRSAIPRLCGHTDLVRELILADAAELSLRGHEKAD